MRITLSLFLVLLFTILFSACDKNRWEIETNSDEDRIIVERFDIDLYHLSQNSLEESEIEELYKNHPKLFPLYMEGVMRFGAFNSNAGNQALNNFVQNEDINSLFKEVEHQYPKGSLSEIENSLDKGLMHYQYYFPNRTIPKIASMVSAFNFATVVDDSLLVIGLDMYLGANYPNYPKTGIPNYKFKNFEKEYIVSDALKAWLFTEFERSGSKNLLEEMIYQGKIIYLLEAFLHDQDNHRFFNYNEEELAWCKKNQSEIWYHFVDQELLYEVANFKIRKYLGDAPFIAGFPEGSPGRVGIWLGYKIVSAYMDKNKNVTLKQLMENANANQILQQSNFKPKRK